MIKLRCNPIREQSFIIWKNRVMENLCLGRGIESLDSISWKRYAARLLRSRLKIRNSRMSAREMRGTRFIKRHTIIAINCLAFIIIQYSTCRYVKREIHKYVAQFTSRWRVILSSHKTIIISFDTFLYERIWQKKVSLCPVKRDRY